MDKKGTRLVCPARQKIVVLVGITEIYIGIPENYISIIVIEYIYTNRTTIPPVIIAPGTMIIGGWFHKKITGHKVITVSDTGYTNKGICIVWLDYFIKQYNYSPISHWRILLINRATYYKALNFIIKAKIHKIWVIKYLLY
jgi:hypothetical protein